MTNNEYNELKIYLYKSLVVLIAVLIVFALSSCKTVERSTTDKSVIDRTDNVRTEIRHTTDTIIKTVYVQVKDSTASERESNTEIEFAGGGGTWNAQTGEATNVQSVRTSAVDKQLRMTVSNLERELQDLHRELQEKNDSIVQLKQQNDVHETHKETRSVWYWWLLVGFVLGFGGLIALKKIPATSWLLFWL